MSRELSFRFKQFGISDCRSGMKLGTDAVLLGAWAECSGVVCAIDIGAGTGIISLMIAQRAQECRVDAVEIDSGACRDAAENFQASPWANRLHLIEGDITNIISNLGRYDLIVSNPPYFSTGALSPQAERAAARHQGALNYSWLLKNANELLADDGSIALVLPSELTDDAIYDAEINRLKLRRQCMICAVEGRKPIRSLLQFYRKDGPIERSTLSIRHIDNIYTTDFKELTRDFYLNF